MWPSTWYPGAGPPATRARCRISGYPGRMPVPDAGPDAGCRAGHSTKLFSKKIPKKFRIRGPNAPVKRKFRIPLLDPRLPGLGASYPAAGPGAGCRLPGRPFFRFFFRKSIKNCSTDSRDQNKIPKKNSKKCRKNAKKLTPDFGPFLRNSPCVKYQLSQILMKPPLSILIFQPGLGFPSPQGHPGRSVLRCQEMTFFGKT